MASPSQPRMSGDGGFPADTALPGWLVRLPEPWRPYAMLARLDRPVGVWLLFLPCLIGLLFQRMQSGIYFIDLGWAALFFVGAVVMRGAGCTWNDISDRDFDARVTRTARRPIPAGLVSVRQAQVFLVAQLAIGLVVWMFLPGDAKLIALLSLPLVAIYPYTKRVTWWPQAWLGLTFNWGVFVGAAAATSNAPPVYLLYFGLVLWTIAYDTIYAMQDREDDALIGVRSTARLFGRRAVLAAFCFHIGAAALIALAAAANGAGRLGAVTALVFVLHGVWQVTRLKTQGEASALGVFKSNVWAGALVAAGFLIAAIVPEPKPRSLFAAQEIVPLPAPSNETISLPFGLELRKRPSQPRKPETWMASDVERTLRARGIEPDATETRPER